MDNGIVSEASAVKADGLPPWFDAESLEAARKLTQSRPLRESWKYSSLRRFEETAAVLAAEQVTPVVRISDATASRFSAGDPRLSQFWSTTIDEARYPTALLASQHQRDGWWLEAAPGAQAEVELSPLDAGFRLLFVDVADNAALELINPDSHTDVSATILAIRLGCNAELTLHQSAARRCAFDWRLISIAAERGARVTGNWLCGGAELRRLDTHIRCVGEHVNVDLAGATVVADRTHCDHQLCLEHQGPAGYSRQHFNGVATRSGKLTFNGRIHIRPDARGTDASLACRNLALDGSSEINAKPELEIYNDDVRCAHGATVGKLDPDALFYLRSRGLGEETARAMLVTAFLHEWARGAVAAAALPSLLETL